jgi:hypothetical protein
MTPKEKAKELVDKFDEFTVHYEWREKNDNAIECALIAVDEVLNLLWHTHKNEIEYRYWNEVKQEIEML